MCAQKYLPSKRYEQQRPPNTTLETSANASDRCVCGHAILDTKAAAARTHRNTEGTLPLSTSSVIRFAPTPVCVLVGQLGSPKFGSVKTKSVDSWRRNHLHALRSGWLLYLSHQSCCVLPCRTETRESEQRVNLCPTIWPLKKHRRAGYRREGNKIVHRHICSPHWRRTWLYLGLSKQSASLSPNATQPDATHRRGLETRTCWLLNVIVDFRDRTKSICRSGRGDSLSNVT